MTPAKRNPIARFLDGVVAAVSPAAGLKRRAARAAAEKFGAYLGASKDRLQENWVTGGGSADADLLPDLPTLRERSRDLCRNDAHAAGAIECMTDNIVGTGIVPQSRVDADLLGISQEQADEFQAAAERAFHRWVPFADAGDRLDFYGMQRVALRSTLENGDVFIHPIMVEQTGADSLRPYSLALELIEADRVDTPATQGAHGVPIQEDDKIRGGVELGTRGNPVAYWVSKQHPSTIGVVPRDNFRRIARRNAVGRPNIIHLLKVKRPGQSRGEPIFAPVISLVEMKAGFMEATLVQARTQALFAAFVKKLDPTGTANARAAFSGNASAPRDRLEYLHSGVIEYLGPDEDVTFANPSSPGNTFDPFVTAILREFAAGIGISYELIARDWSKTTYSSARASIIETRRMFQCWQELWIETFCRPIWRMVLEEAWLNDELPNVRFLDDPEAWSACNWVRPGAGWVDPVKEIEASQLAIQCGFSTRAIECASQGRDAEEIDEQLAREQAREKELGLELATKVQKPAPPVLPGKAAPGEDDGEEQPAPKRERVGATA